MMEFIRTKSKGIVMWAIVGIIVVPFATFGIQDYLSGASTAVPAVVNGYEISSAQLTRAVQSRKQQLQQQLGGNYNPDMFPQDFLRQQVLNDLISRRLVTEFTQTANMSATAKQVYKEITEVPQFKDAKGVFSSKMYSRAIKGAGRNKASFEAEVAQDFILNQLRVGVFNTSFVLPYEVTNVEKLINQQREIAFLTFSKEKYQQKTAATDAELKKYYESHLAQYKTTEKINVEYVELDINDIATRIDISNESINDYYEEHLINYTEKNYPAALARMEVVKRRLDKGESFESLVKSMSADAGELGYISKGIMSKEFDTIAFSLAKGEVSEPVKTDFGYHLIKILDVRGEERKVSHILIKPIAKAKELDSNLRAEIRKELQIQEAEKTFFEDVEKFSNLAYENADSLDAVASGLGLRIKSSGLKARNALTGILINSQVSAAIYSDQVINKSKNSDVIEVKETHMVVVRIKDHQAATQKTFDEVKQDVAKQVAIKQQTEAMKKDVSLAYKNLSAGEKGSSQSALFSNSQWKASQYASRRSGQALNIPESILRKAFTLPRPLESKVSVAIVDMPNGNQAIVVVSGIKDDVNTSIADKNSINQQLQQANMNTEYLGFEQYLKDNADIEINLSKDTAQDI